MVRGVGVGCVEEESSVVKGRSCGDGWWCVLIWC